MSIIGVLTIAQVVSVGVPAGSMQTTSQPTEAIRACIVSNAPAVEKTVVPLNDAADFLVFKVCAGPVADQARQENQARMGRMREQMLSACKQHPAKNASADKKAAADDENENFDMCANIDMMAPMYESAYDTSMYLPNANPAAMSLAAQTLLQLRLKKTGGR